MSTMTSNLKFIGFCGADDSINPGLLLLLSKNYPLIEWGFLFRPDKEGTARYPTNAWINSLITLNNNNNRIMNLAGHLCGERCQELLNGNYDFIKFLQLNGFNRIQINATKANNVNVDSNILSFYIDNLNKAIESHLDLIFILQYNVETKILWDDIIKTERSNVHILFDGSCGLGKQLTDYPEPYTNPTFLCGYAGGISPSNVLEVLENVRNVTKDRPTWIDMESSLRNLVYDKEKDNHNDVFSIDKCYECLSKIYI